MSYSLWMDDFDLEDRIVYLTSVAAVEDEPTSILSSVGVAGRPAFTIAPSL